MIINPMARLVAPARDPMVCVGIRRCAASADAGITGEPVHKPSAPPSAEWSVTA